MNEFSNVGSRDKSFKFLFTYLDYKLIKYLGLRSHNAYGLYGFQLRICNNMHNILLNMKYETTI